ncbi:acyl carrier protein [Embleya sp. NPDC020630]|uniref:acyl carrier protein n=1 Tax=unclassified Embleya TaxID=2699296 RepID=UPI0037BC2A3F
MSADPHADRILAEVAGMLAEIVGEELLIAAEITPDSGFDDDLALESIEFVALAGRLQERYGDRVDFIAFLADLEIEEIMAMTVGRLVEHIAACTRTEAVGGAGR